jgi:phosphoadenosine phosphosulfate reductase
VPLIDSDRLTRKDRDLWAAAWLYDLRRARRPRIGALHERACEEVRRFLADGDAWCSVSWGKDSVVTAEIVAMVEPTARVVHVRMERAENPESERVRDAFLKLHPKLRYDEVVVPWPGMIGDVIAWERIGVRTHRDFFRDALAKHGERRISGIRASESSTRRRSARVHGASTDRSCRPLLAWGEHDVFAFLAAFDLPVHPVYAMTMGGMYYRSTLRVDIIGDDPGEMNGRRAWEAEYFPDVLGALRSEAAHACAR